ncbi:hypothetical protein [Gelidibacter salicanalis]|uniref:Uncharacterized protein n=1 Tax=Gelidibacter salicanalis TaxID=291193 RepID=A0A934KVW5_9FLAO|nr:hypothetical protein [Gelidibacter salicanalis]MBJ7882965.1 hypothetical protein [Gelidibacter salicanalis]
MKSISTVVLLFFTLTLCGQETAIFDKLHSTRIDNAVFVRYDGKLFHYKKKFSDNDASFIEISKNGTKEFQISNDDSNNLKLYLAFYNPLQYTITSAATEIDDSNYTAITTFMNQLPKDMSFMTSITDSEDKVALSLSQVKNYDSVKTKASERKLIEERIKEVEKELDSTPNTSALLYDWIKMFKASIDLNKLIDPLYFDAFKKRIKILQGITAIETYAFKNVGTTINRISVNKPINTLVSAAFEKLYKAKSDDFEGFKKELEATTLIQNDLVSAMDKSKTNLEQLKKMMVDDIALLEEFLHSDSTAVKDKVFRELTTAKLVMIDALVSDKVSKNNQTVEQLIKLNKKLSEFIEGFESKSDVNGYKLLRQDQFAWSYEKSRVYELKAVSLAADGTTMADSGNTIKMKVHKSQGRLAVFASVGLFYTPFEYKNYGLSDDLVVETQGDPVYFRPAAYLNFLLRPKYGDILYPLFQVGVTQGIKTPLIPIGIGISIRNRFSLTAGPLLAFQNELDKLTVGSTTDDAGLKDDLISHIRVSWYISLNYKL